MSNEKFKVVTFKKDILNFCAGDTRSVDVRTLEAVDLRAKQLDFKPSEVYEAGAAKKDNDKVEVDNDEVVVDPAAEVVNGKTIVKNPEDVDPKGDSKKK